MRIRIHRGAEEIGGNCIEVEAAGARIVLDVGMPLEWRGAPRDALPRVSGFREPDPSLLGVIVSHPHPDHWGLLPHLPLTVPVHIGADAKRVLIAAAPFMKDGWSPIAAQTYRTGEMFTIGPFSITPFLNDHSAFDAHSLLIEAAGRRILYSGDIRAHGRKRWAFDRLLESAPRDLDALLLEGTNVGRAEAIRTQTEDDLEAAILRDIRGTRGLVLACFSPQNVDRFVTFFRAARRAGRRFVADPYLARVLDAIDRRTIPRAANSDMAVFLPNLMKRRIVSKGLFDLVAPYRSRRLFPEKLAREASELVMLFRTSMTGDLERAGCLRDATLIYSQWSGYMKRDRVDLPSWCRRNGVTLTMRHTSGHADPAALAALNDALRPKKLIPIHTRDPAAFAAFASNVHIVADGEWFAA